MMHLKNSLRDNFVSVSCIIESIKAVLGMYNIDCLLVRYSLLNLS